VLVHSFNPFVQKRALGVVWMGILAFGFKEQEFSGVQSNDNVGVDHAFEDVKYFEP
jgi:hypothetical protein